MKARIGLKTGLALGGVLLAQGAAYAMSVPVAGDTFFDLYDVVVNEVVEGPMGYVASIGFMGAAGFAGMKGATGAAVGSIVAATMVSRINDVVHTLGVLI